jgi:hypothetical protein
MVQSYKIALNTACTLRGIVALADESRTNTLAADLQQLQQSTGRADTGYAKLRLSLKATASASAL